MLFKHWVVFVVIAVACAVIAVLVAPPTNAGFKDAASVISFAGLVAVAIERVTEFIWTMVGQARGAGGWWPLHRVRQEAAAVETQTNALLTGLFTQLQVALEEAKNVAGTSEDVLDSINAHISALPQTKAALQARLAAAQTLAPGSSRLALAADVHARAFDFLESAAALTQKQIPNARMTLHETSSSISTALAIVAAFRDNPARRIASILIGTGLGMLVTGYMGLNVFAATLAKDAGVLAGVAGIVLTGVLVGLGSSPTHEVIKGLQQWKERPQKTAVADVVTQTVDDGIVMLSADVGGSRLRLRRDAAGSSQVTIRSTD